MAKDIKVENDAENILLEVRKYNTLSDAPPDSSFHGNMTFCC